MSDLISSIDRYRNLGWAWEGNIIEDKERNINIAFLRYDHSKVTLELVCPTGDNSSVSHMVRSMKNVAMPYHICYEVREIEKTVHSLKEQGYTLTTPLEPAVAFENRRVVFLLSRDAGLIELLEKEKH